MAVSPFLLAGSSLFMIFCLASAANSLSIAVKPDVSGPQLWRKGSPLFALLEVACQGA